MITISGKKVGIIATVCVVVVVALVMKGRNGGKAAAGETAEYTVETGDIALTIVTTGVVEPQNRLELKPPVGERVDEILVDEGDTVEQGQIVAWISSTERAALLDAARAKGREEVERWADVYKPTPLIAPIAGRVIVRSVEPGQTLTASSTVLVLSDRLIVKATVDETDIGSVAEGQLAGIALDAYPEERTGGKVDHISYESVVVNNVTTYQVEVLPDKVPAVFRSGMSAEVTIIEHMSKGVVLVPREAVKRDGEGTYVMVKAGDRGKQERRKVTTGAADDVNQEIVSGLSAGEVIIIESRQALSIVLKKDQNNPFMPAPRRRSGGR